MFQRLIEKRQDLVEMFVEDANSRRIIQVSQLTWCRMSLTRL